MQQRLVSPVSMSGVCFTQQIERVPLRCCMALLMQPDQYCLVTGSSQILKWLTTWDVQRTGAAEHFHHTVSALNYYME
jgi:hypothetical protein